MKISQPERPVIDGEQKTSRPERYLEGNNPSSSSLAWFDPSHYSPPEYRGLRWGHEVPILQIYLHLLPSASAGFGEGQRRWLQLWFGAGRWSARARSQEEARALVMPCHGAAWVIFHFWQLRATRWASGEESIGSSLLEEGHSYSVSCIVGNSWFIG